MSVSIKQFIKTTNMLKHLPTEIMRALRLISYIDLYDRSSRQDIRQIPNTLSAPTLIDWWQKGTTSMLHNSFLWSKVNKDYGMYFHTWNQHLSVFSLNTWITKGKIPSLHQEMGEDISSNIWTIKPLTVLNYLPQPLWQRFFIYFKYQITNHTEGKYLIEAFCG